MNPKDLVVRAHDYEQLHETESLVKYSKRRKPAMTGSLSLKDTAVAARNEEQRLAALERQLTEHLAEVRREKRDIEELLGFLERRRGAEVPV